MEFNFCDGNHSDSNLLLPPRKRLLAGFKKQNSNEKSIFDARINDFMKFHLENHNFSLAEIVEKSSKAAQEAVKVAAAARAVAEEKAVVAAKAMAEAKSALELVANISDEAYSQDRSLKKSKTKKHLPVKVFYNKPKKVENFEADKDLSHGLLHAMNSSSRITKKSENSNLKTNKHKRMKGLPTDSEDLISEKQVVSVFEHTSKWNGNDSKSLDDFSSIGRKRGRMKQKKLPLSICSFRDLANTNEETKSSGGLSNKESIATNNVAPSMWKCKAIKTPARIEQNKVLKT